MNRITLDDFRRHAADHLARVVHGGVDLAIEAEPGVAAVLLLRPATWKARLPEPEPAPLFSAPTTDFRADPDEPIERAVACRAAVFLMVGLATPVAVLAHPCAYSPPPEPTPP